VCKHVTPRFGRGSDRFWISRLAGVAFNSVFPVGGRAAGPRRNRPVAQAPRADHAVWLVNWPGLAAEAVAGDVADSGTSRCRTWRDFAAAEIHAFRRRFENETLAAAGAQ